MRRSGRSTALRRYVVPISISVVLIVVLTILSRPREILLSLAETHLWAVAAAILVNVPIVFLRAVRTDLLLRASDFKLRYSLLLGVQLIGQTSSSITPAASGDIVRAYLWRRSANVPLRVGAAVVAFERIYSLGLMIALAVLLITLPRHHLIGWIGVALGLAISAAAPLLIELVPTRFERWVVSKATRGPLSRFAEGAAEVVDNFRRIMRSPRLLAQSAAVTLVIYAISGAQVWLLLAGLNDIVPITQAVAAFAASQTVGILSTLPFGLGTTDATFVALLAAYGVTIGDAAAVAILLRATSTIPQALAGLIAYMSMHGATAQESAA